jgi:DNA polymerase zeta
MVTNFRFYRSTRPRSPEETEHFFLPTSPGSEEEIGTFDTTPKIPHTHEIDNSDSSIAHSSLGVDERTEAITKSWLDDGERRPMKRLKIANELSSQNLTPRIGLFPGTSVKNEILFGTQGPRVFSTQAKKEIKNAFVYAITPPPASEFLSSLESRGLPSKIYQDPHYSRAKDVPERPWEFAGLVYRLKKGDGLSALEEWEPSSTTAPLATNDPAEDRNVFQDRFDRAGVGGWEYASTPPSVREVRRWLTSTTQALVSEKPQARSQVREMTVLHSAIPLI